MRAPASVRPVPGSPGEYINEATGERFKLVEFRDDDIYDTVQVFSVVSQGTKLDVFTVQTDKPLLDTNLDTPRRLPKGTTMLIKRIGVDIPLTLGNVTVATTDVKKLAYSGYLKAEINKISIAEGALYKFPSGYGLAGSSTENNTGVCSIGVPSTAAKRDLEKWHFITSEHDLHATIEFPTRDWDTDISETLTLTVPAHIRIFFGGLISTAATK